MQKSRISVFVQSYSGRYTSPSPFGVPNPAFRIGLVYVDGRFHALAVEVGHIVRLQIDLDVIKVLLPLITDLVFVSRIVISLGVIFPVVVVGDKSNVEEPAVLTRQFALV